MRRIFGLVLAGGLVLGLAPAANAQFSLSIGNPYTGGVAIGNPYGYYGVGNYGYPYSGYQPYGNYGSGYGLAGSTYYNSGYSAYVAPGTTYFNAGSYGVYPPTYAAPVYGYTPYYGYGVYRRPFGGVFRGLRGGFY